VRSIEDEGLELVHTVPWDEALLELDQGEGTIFSLPGDSPSCRAVDRLVDTLVA
jgi:hypothetical protein